MYFAVLYGSFKLKKTRTSLILLFGPMLPDFSVANNNLGHYGHWTEEKLTINQVQPSLDKLNLCISSAIACASCYEFSSIIKNESCSNLTKWKL